MVHDHALMEARAVQKGARTEPFTAITSPPKDNGVLVEGAARYDLMTLEGENAFVASVGRGPHVSVGLIRLLDSADAPLARVEAARVIRAYALAEKQGFGLRRVVLSGHSDSESLGSEGANGMVMRFDLFETLAELFPKAAAQIEHVAIAACYTGGDVVMDLPTGNANLDGDVNYHRMFPSVKTLFAYAGASPSSLTGSLKALRLWERATRGPDVRSLDPSVFKGTRYEENIATWGVEGGYRADQDAQEDLMFAYRKELNGPTFQDYFSGRIPCPNPGKGELKEYYTVLQRMVGSRKLVALLSDEERAQIKREIGQVVRLRYYPYVAKNFSTQYGPALKDGYTHLHDEEVSAPAEPPRFGTLPRKDALAEITRFEAMAKDSPDPSVRHCLDLLAGFRDLSEEVIPFNWIH
jgi:hypothetical protein